MHKVQKQQIITMLITLGVIIIFTISCIGIQIFFACRRLNQRMEQYFDSIGEIYKAQVDVSEDVLYQKSEAMQRLAGCVALYYDEETFHNALAKPPKEQSELLQKICDTSNVAYLLITDDQGNTVFANQPELAGVNLIDSGFLTQEDFELISEMENLQVDIIESVDHLLFLTSDNTIASYMPYVTSLQVDGKHYRVIALVDYEKIFGSVNTILLNPDLSLESESNDEFLIEIYPDKNNIEDSLILYGKYRNKDYMLQPYNAFGFSREVLREGYSGFQHLENGFYYCHTGKCIPIGADTFFVFASNVDLMVDFTSSVLSIVVLAWFCLYLATGRLSTKHGAVNLAVHPHDLQRDAARRSSMLAIIGTICVFGAAFYGQTLSGLSLAIRQTRIGQDALCSNIECVMDLTDSFQESNEEIGISQANLIRLVIEKHPDFYFADADPDAYREYYVTDENGYSAPLLDEFQHPLRSVSEGKGLQKLCESFDMARLTLFNADGYTIADSGSQWYEHIERDSSETASLFQVLDRKTDSLIITDLSENYEMQFAVPVDYYVRDVNGKTMFVTENEYRTSLQASETEPMVRHRYGLLLCTQKISDNRFDTEKKALDFVISSREKVQNCKFMIINDAAEHIIIYADDKTLVDTSADLILSPNTFLEDYNDFFTWNGEEYFLCARSITLTDMGSFFVISMYALPEIFEQRLTISVSLGIVSAVLLAVLVIVLMVQRSKGEITISVETPSGSDSQGEKVPWVNRFIFLYMLAGFMYLFSKDWEDSILRYILIGAWEYGVNLYSLSICSFMVLGLVLLSWLLKKISRFFSLLNARGETVVLLIVSTIKYGASLFVIFFSLHLFGLDTASVLRSLGAFSLIVGLGAQSLIRDIIAGMFVVFEGSYRVGDIVQIKGFRGKVEEIALRTTKVRNLDGNIMIFSNSSIADVENLSTHNSCVYCTLQVPASRNPDEIKEKILRELPEIRKRVPEILDAIEYDGITETNLNGYVIRLIARCRERDRGILWRKMNYELLSLQKKLDLK